MARQVKKVHSPSALPIYGAAGAFVIMAIILPIYKLWAILLGGAIAAGGYFALTKLFPGRDEEREEDVFTGDKELDAQISLSYEILSRFRETAQKAGDEKVKLNIGRIADASEGIVEEVIADKGDRTDAYTFFSYYLPTLDKLFGYYSAFALSNKGANAENSRARIEGCLDMVADAFEKFLDKLYKNEAVAIKASVDLLKTMLKADGLAEVGKGSNPNEEIEHIDSKLRQEAEQEEKLLAAASH